jgi:hypothetical protein
MKLFNGWRIDKFCGSKVYRLSDWRVYGLFHLRDHDQFNIGPILVYRRTS